jgi:hypothetical protein
MPFGDVKKNLCAAAENLVFFSTPGGRAVGKHLDNPIAEAHDCKLERPSLPEYSPDEAGRMPALPASLCFLRIIPTSQQLWAAKSILLTPVFEMNNIDARSRSL